LVSCIDEGVAYCVFVGLELLIVRSKGTCERFFREDE
jgi:hypothetical protein